jgi:CheY-like chemotaxis protein
MSGVGQITTGKKILIVEDTDYLRLLMREVLDSLGPEVEALSTADEAYSFLLDNADEVAVLVADVRMPGRLDGLDLANLVAQKWPHIDVVLTSGYDIGSLSNLRAVNPGVLSSHNRPSYG